LRGFVDVVVRGHGGGNNCRRRERQVASGKESMAAIPRTSYDPVELQPCCDVGMAVCLIFLFCADE
jgi:hypothetical protein